MRAKTDSSPNHAAELPDGVTLSEWNRELGRWQNPRIRSILGCLRVLRDALESNFAILHSSPQRLQELWSIVNRVADAIRREIAPLLQGESRIPELEASRQAVLVNLTHIEQTLLKDLDAFASPEPGPEEDHKALRRFLCVAIGRLNGFLQDSFGSLLAGDPRSSHDADYYLSKEFPRDVEEAEWLYESVVRLDSELIELERERRPVLTDFVKMFSERPRVPTVDEWQKTGAFLERLVEDFTPRLRKVIALRAIRLEELELLAHAAEEIPARCRVLTELHRSSLAALASMAEGARGHGGSAAELPAGFATLHRSLAERIAPQLRGLDDFLRDLGTFVPIWRRGISQRRALMLSPLEKDEPGTVEQPSFEGVPID